jgi:hypothetical protein
VEKAPKPTRSVEESIDAIKEQGGLVVVPHPLGRLVPSLSRKKIDALLERGYGIDGIEIRLRGSIRRRTWGNVPGAGSSTRRDG